MTVGTCTGRTYLWQRTPRTPRLLSLLLRGGGRISVGIDTRRAFVTGAPPTRERDPASGNPVARHICFKRAAHLMHFLAGPGALLSGPCPLAVSPAILCLQFRVVRTRKAPRLAVVSARGVALPVGTLFTVDRLVFRAVSVRRKRGWWCLLDFELLA